MVFSKHISMRFRTKQSLLSYIRTNISTAALLSMESTKFVYEQLEMREKQAVLYIHWPYCAKRCTYCNFNKYVSHSVDHDRMAKCLAQETKTLLELGQISRIKSVFFGGGTPSLAKPSTIETVINTVHKNTELLDGSEVTLEANPTHLTMDRLREFKDVGINRLSLGVQAMNDTDLKLLGRDHSVEQALRCVEEAKTIFPGHVSVDLMFGRPQQTLEQWSDELEKVVDLGVKHVSLYQLTLERGTPLQKWVERGEIQTPDNDTLADMYDLAVQILEENHLKRYEVSNFAEKGHESIHNQAYWNGEDYVGVGPGAHGRFTPIYTQGNDNHTREERIQALLPENWMSEVERWGHGTKKIVQQSQLSRLKELLMLSLRTKNGLSVQRWSLLCPTKDLLAVFSSDERIDGMLENELIELDEKGLKATDRGITVLDSIISNLLFVLEDNIRVSETQCDTG